MYPPAILSRGPRSRWIPLLLFIFFSLVFFFTHPPRPIETRARRLWTNARSTVLSTIYALQFSPRALARARFHLRLSHFDYLLREAYRLLIYSVVTNYDDLAGQRRYLFPPVRTSGFWWKRDCLRTRFPGEDRPLPEEKKHNGLSVEFIT